MWSFGSGRSSLGVMSVTTSYTYPVQSYFAAVASCINATLVYPTSAQPERHFVMHSSFQILRRKCLHNTRAIHESRLENPVRV